MSDMQLYEAEVRLPGSHRHMFQGNQGEAVDVDMTGRRRDPMGAPRIVTRILQEAIDFLCDLRCQFGFRNRRWLAPPILGPHLLGPRWTTGPF